MKLGISRRSISNATVKLLATALITLTLIPLKSTAHTPQNISTLVGEIKPNILSITVIAIDPNELFRSHLSEKDFLKFGCKYLINKPGDIAALVELIVQGNIVETPPFYKFGPDPRLGLYIETANGGKHKFLFTGTFTTPKLEFGTYNDATSVVPQNLHFANNLRAFIAPREPQPSRLCTSVSR